MTTTAYRITKKEFAATIWSGVGARDFGGRWNSKGVAVVYASQNRALAAMEQLVHLVKPRILKGFVVANITFEEDQIQWLDIASLPSGWRNRVAPAPLRRYGDRWIAAARHPVLAVPSVVVPGEWNFLLNPAHPEFKSLPRSNSRAFVYDGRLA